MTYPISDVTRRVVYSGSAGVGPYSFTFEILTQTDIAVYKNSTLLTLTTDYTVTINVNGTGSITLVSAATGADRITIVGDRGIQRTTDFVTGGDLFANTLNQELDALTIYAQQIDEKAERGLKAPVTDPTDIAMTLPSKTARANKNLAFDANGNPTTGEVIGDNRGNWAAGNVYNKRDIVKDTTNGNVYYCNTAHTSSGSLPISTNTDSAKWDLLVDNASAGASASAAAASASAAATSASNASTSATNAASSASTASTQATNAANSASAAAASYDSFDDRYLGAKATDPTLDNDGNALIDGALYFDTTLNVMKVYDLGGTVWKRTTPTTTDQANIDAAVANATNINTVAGISANVTTVANNSANVTTVAGSIANVNTNATNIANINQNAANIVAIQNASTNATNAANSATAAASSATSAAASAAAASAVVLGNEPVRHSVRPSLLLDFANTKQLDPRITFTRASTGTFYDGRTVAKAEENLILQSQAFDAGWVISGVGISATANTSVAPDGTTTADTIIEDTANSIHTSGQTTGSGLVTTSGVVTFSVFAKLGSGTRFLTIGVSKDASNHGSATFDLSLGTNTQTQATGTYSAASATITASTQGFYRCTFTVTTDSVTAARVGLNNTGAPTALNRGFGSTYTGDGTSSLIVWGAQLEQRSSVTAYTATTTQTITNYVPALQTAAAGVARFDHNPVTGESLGLEIEEQRTNLLTYSDQFDNAAWTKARSSITANTIVAPDGALTGDKLVEDTTASNTHTLVQPSISFASGTSYTLSIYAKVAERTVLRLTLPSAAFGAAVAYNFDLANSTTTLVTAGTSNSAAITSVGNGWYRCTVTAQATATASSSITLFLVSGGSASYTGDGYSGIYIWGAQLEAGAFVTSYIPTVAAQVTRSADAASMTGANFSSWYRADEGTFLVQVSRANVGVTAGIVQVDDGTNNNRIAIQTSSTEKCRIFVVTGNVTQTQVDSAASLTANTLFAGAMAYATNDVRSALNGTALAADTSATLPVVSTLRIGQGTSVLSASNLRRVVYYPLRLTDAELQGLTTV